MTIRALMGMGVVLAALAGTAPAAQAAPAAPASKDACHCAPKAKAVRHPRRRAATTARGLHRPSTAAERAETRRLNREFLARAQKRGAASQAMAAMAPAPPAQMRQDQTPYRDELHRYRDDLRAYDRQMRAYYEKYPPGYGAAPPPPPRTDRAGREPPPAYALEDETARQDAARLAPWHGYNNRRGNGY